MLFLIPGLWIAGNWIPLLSIANVSIAGLAVMMAPGMRLLDFDEFQKAVPWNVVLMVGSVLSLGSILATTGGAAFLADLFMGCGILALDFTLIMVLSSLIIYTFHTFCPIGPAAIGLFLPLLAGVCMQFGVSPTSSAILLSFIVAGNFLLPINPTLTVTYSTGYYTFGDMFKTGIVPSVALVLIMAAWMPFIVGSWACKAPLAFASTPRARTPEPLRFRGPSSCRPGSGDPPRARTSCRQAGTALRETAGRAPEPHSPS